MEKKCPANFRISGKRRNTSRRDRWRCWFGEKRETEERARSKEESKNLYNSCRLQTLLGKDFSPALISFVEFGESNLSTADLSLSYGYFFLLLSYCVRVRVFGGKVCERRTGVDNASSQT